MNDAIRSTIIKYATRQVVSFFVSKVPFLGFAIINPIVGWIASWIIGILLDKTILGVSFSLIDLEVDSDVDDIKNGLSELQSLPKDAPKEEKEKKEDEVAKRYIDLFKLRSLQHKRS